ncbi:patatin-like protein [Allosphingosinicella sp.]|jgi:patatin-related protein|uniref:patatin-like protein n=1 Tax=Allosphingosinicella sp. TaxID=2823234 RepID=UPI002EE88A9B
MREKELRLALICYGGVSLAVYMHGITKEVWHLARASRGHHSGEPVGGSSEKAYGELVAFAEEQAGVSVRVLVDILAGASAGGINAIFLADAISTGRSLEPLTALWLDGADVDRLLDDQGSALSRFAKSAAVPLAWVLSRRGAEDRGADAAQRSEIRAKVASFIRARWFSPPFSGRGFTSILLDALEAMRTGETGPSLLPAGHPLDLSVTVTDFHGFPQRLRLNSPPEVLETEHRLTLSFHDPGGPERALAEAPDLAFAARATASFPGAFPPFTVAELDSVLAARGEAWPGRDSFLAAALPRYGPEEADRAVLIDGSILANAPFRPAIAALQNRHARREVDRRFVYIDPKPGVRSIRFQGAAKAEPPGFFATIFGAMSDIPREQPIRDNLDAIEARSARIRRLGKIVEAIRPQVEAVIDRAFGGSFHLMAPTPKRIAGWRRRAHDLAAKEAGFAYSAYGQLKLARVVEDVAVQIARSGGLESDEIRDSIWAYVRSAGIAADHVFSPRGTSPETIDFLGKFDIGFRIRRMRFVARQLDSRIDAPELRGLIDDLIGSYRSAARFGAKDEAAQAMTDAGTAPDAALEALAPLLDLRGLDREADSALSAAVAGLARPARRALIAAYLGFSFYDIATFPLLQEDGLDEFDAVKIDRISPDDAVGIRSGGAAATLKGIQFNSFGAFFSRGWRENDYLWGRLHGADRLVDILVSTLPESKRPDEALVKALKKRAFRAILGEEKERLTGIPELLESLEREIG